MRPARWELDEPLRTGDLLQRGVDALRVIQATVAKVHVAVRAAEELADLLAHDLFSARRRAVVAVPVRDSGQRFATMATRGVLEQALVVVHLAVRATDVRVVGAHAAVPGLAGRSGGGLDRDGDRRRFRHRAAGRGLGEQRGARVGRLRDAAELEEHECGCDGTDDHHDDAGDARGASVSGDDHDDDAGDCFLLASDENDIFGRTLGKDEKIHVNP